MYEVVRLTRTRNAFRVLSTVTFTRYKRSYCEYSGPMFSDININAGRFHSWYINPCVRLANRQLKAQMSSIPDELTTTVLSIVGSLPTLQKAKLLLDHCLALLEAGK